MSKQIENEVVKMTFDNKDFEKNISTSTKSIEKLNEDLKFKDAEKGFRDVEKYANSVNFDGLTKAIENINSVFTVTGNLSKKIIDDIAGYFESKIVGAVRSVSSTVSYIMDTNLGVSKYEQYTTAMNTLRANMTSVDQMQYDAQHAKGEFENELEYINMYMDKILTFTDETSYSFSDMVDTIAKFTSSDVDLERASAAIMGMANVAAVAGQNANVATMSMQQLAQSFGVGYVKYQDWQQAFTSKNLVTKELKQTLVDAALGVTLDEKDIEKAKAAFGEKNYADFFFTSEMLGKQWLNTDQVLVKGLSEYSKASTEILDTMEKIAYSATVTDMLGWVEDFKDANEKGKASAQEFAETIAKDYGIESADQIKAIAEMVDKLSGAEYELSLKAFLAAQQATNFHEAIDATRDAVGTKMMNMLTYFIGDLDQARVLWTDFANALWNIFAGPLDATLEGLEKFNTEVAETVEVEGELVEITWYDKFWDGVARAFNGIGGIINDFLDIIRIFAGAFEEVEDDLGETTIETESIIEKYTFGFMKKVTNAVSKIADAIEKFRNSTVMELLLDVFKNLVQIFIQIRKITHTITSAVIGTALKNIHKPLEVILKAIVKILEVVNKFLNKVINGNTFNKLISALKTITKLCVDLFTNVLKKAGNILEKLVGYLKDIWDWLGSKLSPLFHSILDFVEKHTDTVMETMADGIDLVSDAFDWLIQKFKDAKDWFKNFISEITGTDFKTLNEDLKNLGSGFIEGMSGVGSRTLEVTKKYASSVFDPNNKASIPYLVNELKGSETAIEGAQKAIGWMGNALSNPIRFVFDMVGAILNTDLSKAADLICNFIERVSGAIAKVTPAAMEIVGKVIDVLAWVVIHAIDLIKKIVSFAAGTITTTGSTVLDKVLDAVILILQVLLYAIITIFEMVAKIANFITPYVLTLMDYIGIIVQKMLNKITEIVKDLSEQDPKELFHSAVGLLFLVAGILVVVKVIMLVYDAISLIAGFGGPIKKLSVGLLWVCDSFSGLLDTLGGYGVPGMILYFSLLITSIGYAMASMAKVAEGFADPEKRDSYFLAIGVCFLFFIGIMLTMRMLLKSIMKQSDLLERDTSSFNFGGALIGVAAIIISVAFALTRIVDTVGPDNIDAVEIAALCIIGIIASLALFLKVVAGDGEYSAKNVLKKGEGFGRMVSKSGTTYEGIASAVRGLATGLAIIMLAMGFLAKTLDNMSDPDLIWKVFGVVELLLLTLGAFVIVLNKLFTSTEYKNINKLKDKGMKTNFTRNGGSSTGASFLQSAGLVALIYGIMSFVVVVTTAIVLAAVIIEKNDISMGTVAAIAGIIVGIMVALGFVMWLVMKVADESDKWAIKAFLKKIAKMLLISLVFTTFAIVMAVICGSVASLTATIAATEVDDEEGDADSVGKKDSGKQSPLTRAFNTILNLLGIMFAFAGIAMILAKYIDAANLAAVAGVFLSMAIMIKVIAAAIVAMVVEFAIIPDKAIKEAVGSMAIILGLIMALAVSLALIGMFLGGGSGYEGAAMITAIGAAIMLISAGVWSLAKALIALTAVCAGGAFDDMLDALGVLGLALAGILVFVLVLSLIGYAFGAGFITIAIGLGILVAAILALDLAILLLVPAVELATNYLVDKEEAISAAFIAIGLAIGSALGGIIVGFVQSIANAAPMIIDALISLLTTVIKKLTAWLEEPETARMFAEFWFALLTATVNAMLYFGSLLLVQIGEWISLLWNWLANNVIKPIDAFIKRIRDKIVNAFLTALDFILWPFKKLIQLIRKLFKWDSPSGLFEDLGSSIMQGLLNGVKKGWDAVVGIFQSLVDFISSIFENGLINTVENSIEKALNSGKTLAEKDHEKAVQREENLTKDVLNNRTKGYIDVAQEYIRLYKAVNQGWYRDKSEEEAARKRLKEMEESTTYYSIQGFKQLSTGTKNQIYNHMKDLGYWTSAGFLQGIYANGDPEQIGSKYMNELIDGNKKAADIHSPSGVFEGIGTNIVNGLKNGIDLSSIKDLGSEMMGSLTEGFTDNLGGLTDITGDMSNMIDTSSMMPDMSSMTTQFDGSSLNVGTSSMYGNTGLTDIGTMDNYMNTDSLNIGSVDSLGGNLDAYTSTQNAQYASSAVDSASTDIVEQLKKMNENLLAWREASSKTEIYMDTGALVGEVVEPLDKELGKRANLKANRGV